MSIDTHAHLTSAELIEDVEGVIERAKAAGLKKIVNICTDVVTLERGIALAEKHNWIFNAAATTPHDVEKEGESFFPYVEDAVRNKKLVAIGETGLDYHYTHSPKELQRKFLVRYLNLASVAELPVIFHCRDAFEDLFAITADNYPGKPALLHCFTGTIDEALKGVERGWLISFSGIITFKKSQALRDVARAVPLSHIAIETDAPYLAPQTRRGSVNEPAFITETIQTLADVKGISAEEVMRITAENAVKFFSF